MYPANLKYTKDHEWIRAEGSVYTVGITSFAAEQLGDVTYVELPKVGAQVTKGKTAAAVESVKAASDVYSPATGKVTEINAALEASPELVNQGPYETGWFFKLENVNAADLSELMDASAYEAFVKVEH